MSRMILPFLVALIFLGCADGKSATADKSCTPSYREMDDVIRIHVGNFELSFRLLAIGCDEDLEVAWPPKRDLLERELALELQDTHPIQTALTIRDRPDLRKRLASRINSVIDTPAVTDVFPFEVKVAEFGL